jgi:hypothetical protein
MFQRHGEEGSFPKWEKKESSFDYVSHDLTSITRWEWSSALLRFIIKSEKWSKKVNMNLKDTHTRLSFIDCIDWKNRTNGQIMLCWSLVWFFILLPVNKRVCQDKSRCSSRRMRDSSWFLSSSWRSICSSEERLKSLFLERGISWCIKEEKLSNYLLVKTDTKFPSRGSFCPTSLVDFSFLFSLCVICLRFQGKLYRSFWCSSRRLS